MSKCVANIQKLQEKLGQEGVKAQDMLNHPEMLALINELYGIKSLMAEQELSGYWLQLQGFRESSTYDEDSPSASSTSDLTAAIK